jgi:hypothetical protein
MLWDTRKELHRPEALSCTVINDSEAPIDLDPAGPPRATRAGHGGASSEEYSTR